MSDKHEKECPICGNEWKITGFGAKIWRDCLKCNDTAENLITKYNKNRSESEEKSTTTNKDVDNWKYNPYGFPHISDDDDLFLKK